MANFAVTPTDTTIVVQVGENTAAAAASATLSQAWAEGTLPGGAGTKSAKTWAGEAEASAGIALDARGQLIEFETLDLGLSGSITVLDLDDRLVMAIPDPADQEIIDSAVTVDVFETLDPAPGVVLLDDDGKEVVRSPDTGTVPADLTARINRGLTPYGDLLGPTVNEWTMRRTRMKLRRLRQANGGQLSLVFCGDSWVQADSYWLRQFAKALQDQYGYAAAGFVGFQWFGTASGTWVDGGSQPSGGGAGNARGDLIAAPVFSGEWNSDNGAGGFASPSIGWAETSAASAYVRFTVPAGHNAADLHFVGTTAGGTVDYSWDGGATWQTAIDVSGTDGVPDVAALANVPTEAATLRLRRASGTIRLSGVNLKSTNAGVVVHKLGASGSTTSQWAAVNLTTWATQVATLAPDAVIGLMATNDASGGTPASTVGANAAAIMAAIAANSAAIDRMWIMPPQRAGTPAAAPMAGYAEQVRRRAVDGGFAYLDLQYTFGPNPGVYANAGAFPLLDASNTHPATATGGALIADAAHRIIAPVL